MATNDSLFPNFAAPGAG
jgi:hypothetical protein